MPNREIIGYEGHYSIDEHGIILNMKSKIYKKPNIANTGYYVITLYKNNKSKTYLLHRLIAIHFIPNPNNKPCINHIDGNRLNDELSNLEWVTHQENMVHAWRYRKRTCWMTGLKGKDNCNSKPVIAKDSEGNIFREFDAISDAERELGIFTSCICNNLKGRTKNAGGFIWEYK